MSRPIDDVSELDLQAYADGKLPEERLPAVAAWLAAHPDDAERIESYRRLAEEVRSTYGAVLEEPVPERLSRALRPARVRRAALIALWVGLGAALGAMVGWHLHLTQTPPAAASDPATRPDRQRSQLERRAAVLPHPRGRRPHHDRPGGSLQGRPRHTLLQATPHGAGPIAA